MYGDSDLNTQRDQTLVPRKTQTLAPGVKPVLSDSGLNWHPLTKATGLGPVSYAAA